MFTSSEMIKVNTIKAVRPGSFVRICYKTELPVQAQFKAKGYRVEKEVEMTSRFGVAYHHIASVIERELDRVVPAKPREHTTHWITGEKKYFLHNDNSGTNYVVTYPTKSGTNKKSTYIVYDAEGRIVSVSSDDSEARKYVIRSYFTRRGNCGQLSIKLENLLAIGNTWFD